MKLHLHGCHQGKAQILLRHLVERDIEGTGSIEQAELGGIFLDHAVEAAAAGS